MTPNYIVPWSCCKLSSGSDCLVMKSTDAINKIGCLTPLYNDLIRDNVWMFAAVMIGCLLIQVPRPASQICPFTWSWSSNAQSLRCEYVTEEMKDHQRKNWSIKIFKSLPLDDALAFNRFDIITHCSKVNDLSDYFQKDSPELLAILWILVTILDVYFLTKISCISRSW